jgi:hypothetical protein
MVVMACLHIGIDGRIVFINIVVLVSSNEHIGIYQFSTMRHAFSPFGAFGNIYLSVSIFCFFLRVLVIATLAMPYLNSSILLIIS